MQGWIAAGIAGLCFGLAPLDAGFGPLIWLLGVIALGRAPRGHALSDIARGALVGGLWYGLSLRWIALQWVDLDGSLTLPTVSWLGVTLVQAIVPAVGTGLAGALLHRGWPRHLALPVAWAAATSLAPWVQPLPGGLAVYGAGSPVLLWPAAWLGIPGFVAVAGVVSALVGRRPALGFPLLVAWALIGLIPWFSPRDPALSIGIVQPNTGAFDARRSSTAQTREAHLIALVQEAHDAGVDTIVTPETAWPHGVDLRRERDHARLASAFGAYGTVILGAAITDGDPPTNSLLRLEQGRVVARQDKVHLVPVSEKRFAGLGRDVFRAGTSRVPLGELAGVICYEDLVPQGLRGLGAARWVLGASNDAWLGPGPGAAQHLAAARLGAVRSGRWLVRPTANGRSAVFDPRGETRWEAPWVDGDQPGQPGIVGVVDIHPRRPWWSGADVEPWLAVFFALLAAAMGLARGPVSIPRREAGRRGQKTPTT